MNIWHIMKGNATTDGRVGDGSVRMQSGRFSDQALLTELRRWISVIWYRLGEEAIVLIAACVTGAFGRCAVAVNAAAF